MGAEEARRPRPYLINHRASTHSVAHEDHAAYSLVSFYGGGIFGRDQISQPLSITE